MMPRPRARGREPLVVPAADALAAEVERLRQANYVLPAALVTGHREWVRMRRDPQYRRHAQFWPGGEETFAGVPVVVSSMGTTPKILETQQALEDMLLGPAE